MDLCLLGAAYGAKDSQRERLTLAAAAVLGVTVLDVIGAQQHAQGRSSLRSGLAKGQGGYESFEVSLGERARRATRRLPGMGPLHVTQVITINRPPEEVYRFWHNFQNLPTFMSHLEKVETRDAKRAHWKAKGPAGVSVEWDAEITEDRPNEFIAWRSLPGADVENQGSVRFQPAPGSRGTEVRVELSHRPPAGAVGARIAKLFGEAPEQQIAHDLRALKQVMETGEVVHSDASIHRGPHPGAPAARRIRPEHRSEQTARTMQTRGAQS